VSNFKPFLVSTDPIQLIRDSDVPLRLQDIAKTCEGDRRQILRRIESEMRKERKLFAFYIGILDDGVHPENVPRVFRERIVMWEDLPNIPPQEEGPPYPFFLNRLYVRKGMPVEFLKQRDFETIRSKWVMRGKERKENPKGWERLFCNYLVLSEILSIRKIPRSERDNSHRAYPLHRDSYDRWSSQAEYIEEEEEEDDAPIVFKGFKR